MTVYIYSFIEGETKWSKDGPSEIDLDAVGDGQLSILKIVIEGGEEEPPYQKVFEVDPDGKWNPATEAELAMTHGQEWHE